MIGTMKMLAMAGALVGATAMAQPALADHGGHGGVSLGIGFNVRPSRGVVVNPGFFAPNYIATPPYYGYLPYGVAPYYPPANYYMVPQYYAPQVVYPPGYYGYYNSPYVVRPQRLTHLGILGIGPHLRR